MQKPKFPIITIYNKALDIIPGESNITKASVLGILKGNADAVAFDSNQGRWAYELKSKTVKDNFITRFLANTIYNPSVDITPIWTKQGTYHIDELKKKIIECIEVDDDILTQFIEPDVLKKAIDTCISFEEIYQALKKYVFEVNEEELSKEDKANSY